MKFYAVSAALFLLAHLGVPAICCGPANCEYMDAALIERGKDDSIVRVSGKEIRVANSRIYSPEPHEGHSYPGVYCWKDAVQACEGVISDECALCVGITWGAV